MHDREDHAQTSRWSGMARSRVITFLCWLRDQMTGRAARVGYVERRLLRPGICLAAACFAFAAPAPHGENLAEALAQAYQTHTHLNAERTRHRATDENGPHTLAP